VYELKDGAIKSYNVAPEDFGLSRAEEGSLSGGSAATNAALLHAVFEGTPGPRRDAVLLNAAAALVAGDSAHSLQEGVPLARKALDCGGALAKLEELIEFGNCL